MIYCPPALISGEKKPAVRNGLTRIDTLNVPSDDPAIEALRAIVDSRNQEIVPADCLGLAYAMTTSEFLAVDAAIKIDDEAGMLLLRALAWKYGFRWVESPGGPPPNLLAEPKM